tara:strand:- start:468 stop:701 length:234 start_codon:yes stop_codon:yes gene_type:complete
MTVTMLKREEPPNLKVKIFLHRVCLSKNRNEKERNKFYKWTLIETTILYKKEWLKLFKFIGFKGDYYFLTTKSLGLE